MSDLSELYQQIIIDHSREPHNFKALKEANYIREGFNPLCGDKVKLFVHLENNHILDLGFQGSGCAISTAAASLMSDAVKGRTPAEVLEMFQEYQELVTTGKCKNQEKLGKLITLAGVAEYPMRVKCATLAWHTLKQLLAEVDENQR